MKIFRLKYLVPVTLTAIAFAAGCAIDPEFPPPGDGHTHSHVHIHAPQGFPEMPIPANNPTTAEGVALGRKLFYDPILSGDNTQSCGSCHRQSYAFTDSTTAFSTGIDGLQGNRNAMPIFNLGWTTSGFFWDGGASDMESQVVGPIQNPLEMHQDLSACIAELQAHPEYPQLFQNAFGSNVITTSNLMKAVAQFERTIISSNSRYDKWYRNEPGGNLTPQELNGMSLFQDMNKGDCVHCHSLGGTFTDFEYRNTGLDSIAVDSGRARITLNVNDLGKFKTPSLRNVELTSPYMHDGRFTTLEQVLDHYNTGFHYAANLDPNLAFQTKGRMTVQEMADIIAFLKTLTDYSLLTNPDYGRP